MPRGRKYKYGGWNQPLEIFYTFLVAVKVYVVKVDGLHYSGCNVPSSRKCKYGGWNLPRGIIYTFLVAVKIYVNEIDGTSRGWLQRATRTDSQLRWLELTTRNNLHFLGSCQGLHRQGRRNFTTVAATYHTNGISSTVAGICHTG